jgi:hypothetical protein
MADKTDKERSVWRDRKEHFIRSLIGTVAVVLVGAVVAAVAHLFGQ